MSASIPSDFVPFVQRMIAGGRFLNEEDVLAEGLRMLQARETLKDAVALGFEQLDAGQSVPADQVYDRAERCIARIERGEK
jgi:antitoxin ParD1/3/4